MLCGTLAAASLATAQDEAVAPAESPVVATDSDTSTSNALDLPQQSQRQLGAVLASDDQRHAVEIWLRGQIRVSGPFDVDPLRRAEFDGSPGYELFIPRARLNVRGHLFTPKFRFFYVHELSRSRPLLDLGIEVQLRTSLQLRAGQYKVPYNRERVDSSSDQQFVERSIANYAFTVDRQRGITLSQRWATGTTAQNRLLAGIFDGAGRTSGQSGDDPMIVIRWEWDFLGETLPFSQSDLRMRSTPAASLAFGAASVEGPYTRYSTAGGGQLDGFEPGDSTRYHLEQWLQEFAWRYRGFSVQQEFHVKTIVDNETAQESELSGGYLQLGKVWPLTTASWALPVEIAFRYAHVAWKRTSRDRDQHELTAVFNVFFEGHRNKLSFDVSRLDVEETSGITSHDTRLRAQWEVSF